MNNAERESLYETTKKQQRILNVMQERLEKTGAESNKRIANKVKARLNKTRTNTMKAFRNAGLPAPRNIGYNRVTGFGAAEKAEGEALIDIAPILAEQGFGHAVQQARFASPELLSGNVNPNGSLKEGSHAWVLKHTPATSEAAAARAMRRGPDGSTQLIRAVRAGDEAEVSRLIQLGAPLNSANIHGITALLTAAIYHPTNDRLFALLLAAGADPNKADQVGATPLLVVAGKLENTSNVCRLLLENKADPNQEDEYGSTPLIMSFIFSDDVDRSRLLLEKGADVNKVDKNGRTALIEACRRRKENACRLLLENGANVNQADENGRTALIEACERGQLSICRLLVDKGADINHSDNQGRTALIYAADSFTDKFMDHISICKLLLENGADINQSDENGRTALIIACERGNEDLCRFLLDAGADINKADKNGRTALIIAKRSRNNDEIVEFFETWIKEHPSGSDSAVMGGTRKRRHRKVKKTKRRTLASSRVKRQ